MFLESMIPPFMANFWHNFHLGRAYKCSSMKHGPGCSSEAIQCHLVSDDRQVEPERQSNIYAPEGREPCHGSCVTVALSYCTMIPL